MPEFGLKILPRMMLLLAADVSAHGLDLPGADTEFAVATLPREIGIPRVLLLEPHGRPGFHLLNNFCGRVVFGLGEQDVNVVAHGIDFDQGRIMVLKNAGDVGVELAALVIAKKWAAVLGAEHEVNDDVGKGLGHDV
jgi:hypothetical protein